MSEPKRLLELGLPATTAAVLGSADDDQPTAQAEERAWRAMGLGTVGVATGVAVLAEIGWRTKLSGKLLRLLSVKWFGVAAIPALAAGSYFAARSTTEVPRPTALTVATVHPAPTASVTPLAVEAPPPPPQPAPSVQRVNPAPEPGPSAKNGVERELAALDECRRSIARGDTTAALHQLDVYRRVFPHGTLATEAALLKIQALAASGRSSAP